MNAPQLNQRPKFALGQIVITTNAAGKFAQSGDRFQPFLSRHQQGDWGDLDNEDRQANDEAVRFEGDPDRQSRVLSAYQLKDGTKIWIITEWDRSVTTLLLPEDY